MWRLVFGGDLVTGFRRQDVVKNLARRLDWRPEQVEEQLFTGQSVEFKVVDSEDEAQQWRKDFADAGALLMVLPHGEDAPGGSRYAGADPANVNIEEPTPASVFARLPAIRRRNRAMMMLGAIALVLAVLLISLAYLRA